MLFVRVEEKEKCNPLFRGNISDSLSLLDKILQIKFDVFFLFFTVLDGISMLLFMGFLVFFASAPLVSKRLESLILSMWFCVAFDFNLVERQWLLQSEDVFLYVTTFSVLLFS